MPTEDFEETSLPGILQHVNKFDNPTASTPASATVPLPGSTASAPPSRAGTPQPGVVLPGPRPQQDKLAMATAVFVATGLTTPAVLASVRKEHLVKDGVFKSRFIF